MASDTQKQLKAATEPAVAGSEQRPCSAIMLAIEGSAPLMYVHEVRGIIFVTFTVEESRAALFPTDKGAPECWRASIETIAGVPLEVVSPNDQAH